MASDNTGVELGAITSFLDELLRIRDVKDYPGAWNGLQVETNRPIRRVVCAVDASAATTRRAVEAGADLLMVHHGLFWDNHRPIVGRYRARLAPLIEHGIAVYSAHLPLDAHPEVGNNALLLRALGLEPEGEFGLFQGATVGRWASADLPRTEILTRLEQALGGAVRNNFFFGPERCRRVGVITGGGGSEIRAAAEADVDCYITGEGPQHTFFDAQELGLNVIYGGHYATETFGVKALGRLLADRFGLSWEFLDLPTGL